MKLKHIVLITILGLIFGISIWKLLPVIEYLSGKTIHWQQEAPLHDGRMLVVERVSKLGPSNLFGQSTRMEIEQTLSFKHPDTGEQLSMKVPDGLWPVMIDFEQGTPWLLLRTAMSSDYSKWGCPNPPWLAYRYQDGKWRLASFETFPVSLAWLNLIPISKSVPRQGGLLSDRAYVNAERMEEFWGEILWREEPNVRKRLALGREARWLSREKLDPRRVTSECSIVELVAQGRESEIDEETWARAKKEEERFSREVKPEDQVFLKKKWAKETETAIKELKQRLEIEK